MPRYKQLNLYEREEISRGLSQGLSFREIANLTNRSASTISRELKRNFLSPLSIRPGRRENFKIDSQVKTKREHPQNLACPYP